MEYHNKENNEGNHGGLSHHDELESEPRKSKRARLELFASINGCNGEIVVKSTEIFATARWFVHFMTMSECDAVAAAAAVEAASKPPVLKSLPELRVVTLRAVIPNCRAQRSERSGTKFSPSPVRRVSLSPGHV
ncbi:hypothetical protein PF005_g32013 [Phytophthora fragariae]|uniref:Uncharacterized protein n=1 Tax=Phytophthora fragariae TaxID=53985 RepID=A0A6A4ASM0_9STRA|nr:hypothetical protein PF009_g32030 [Phytophthora fragariae]KAE9003917.1 hypothetical protein PF011_g12680 [Phytophthora fragariae]KAE9056723.1 hypothetical protein PF010_g31656 [Phytophthora fragariae]KAE9057565.1 hypothetical protein PF007_g31605 [Phytophthora fragariae]KAE9059767.1 hypothetical protein PF006_g31796 [Phytophthora fragariae]